MKSDFIFEYSAPQTTNKKMPSIFLFHGYRSNEKDLLPIVKSLRDTHHIFSLRGSIAFHLGYAYWDIEAYDRPVRKEYDQSMEAVQAFIREAIPEYNLNPKDMTFLGFSQGAVLVQSLALTVGKPISKVVALSGYVPYFVKEKEYHKQPVDHLKIFISHGINDTVAPYRWGEESRDYFESLGAQVTFKSYSSDHYVSPENKQDLIKFITGA